MKDWKIDFCKSSYAKTFAFSDHQGNEKSQFLSHLLKFNSKQYKIDVVSIGDGCIVSFILQKIIYKMAVDNILNSIDLSYEEFVYGKED